MRCDSILKQMQQRAHAGVQAAMALAVQAWQQQQSRCDRHQGGRPEAMASRAPLLPYDAACSSVSLRKCCGPYRTPAFAATQMLQQTHKVTAGIQAQVPVAAVAANSVASKR